MRKLTFLVGFGTGYVLGSRAGRERYEQIVRKARELAGMPAVQEAKNTIVTEAAPVIETAKKKVTEKVGGKTVAGDGTRSMAQTTPVTADPYPADI